MSPGTGGEHPARRGLQLLALLLAPALVGGALTLLAPLDGRRERWALGALSAVATAAWMVRRLGERLDAVHAWALRIRAGQRSTPPLAATAPDALDELIGAVGAAAGELGAEIDRLKNERDRLEAILAAMAEGVIVIDGHGAILRANGRALSIFGLPPGEDPIGRRLWDLSRDVEFNTVVREALASQRPTFREVELRAGNESRFLRITVGPTADGSAWVLVFHDVTETKRLERVRTDFVANVSHELRTPLTAIKGFAETLSSSGFADAERAARYVGIIDRQAERLSRLIDDLLILSDLELGRSPIRVREVPVADAVREVVELLAEPARRQGVTVCTSVPRDVVVLCDPDRLAQVVSNLLDNAIKYTPEGGRVSIEGRHTADGSAVEIVVADTGAGIPAEDLPRVAERFYRVDKARERERGGTGLGLAIVKHIVQAHDGRLAIESRVGGGTRVTVTLPTPAGAREAAVPG